jgi:hypothetical protein
MSEREFELWALGFADRQQGTLEMLAWMQANLMNVHIPRGRSRIRPEHLLPKKGRQAKPERATADEDREALKTAEAVMGKVWGGAQGSQAGKQKTPKEVFREMLEQKRAAKAAEEARIGQERDRAFWAAQRERRVMATVRLMLVPSAHDDDDKPGG